MSVKNRTIFTGDNLDILWGMNSASVNLMCLNPPFKSDKQWTAHRQPSRRRGIQEHADVAWREDIRAAQPGLDAVCQTAGVEGHGELVPAP